MKIAIIGAGAMGSLYGGRLCDSGNEVYLLDIWKEHVDKINEMGLIIIEKGKETLTHPVAVTGAEQVGIVDLAIIFVKSIHTENAVKENRVIFGDNTLVLSLQNGHGNIEKIAMYISNKNIIAGTTAHGATLIGPGRVIHAGIGETHIGSVGESDDERIKEIEKVLKEAGFEITISKNVMELIWAKLFINVGINALTAILEIRNGQLLDYEESIKLMNKAVGEAVEVANHSGMDFDEFKIMESVAKVANATAKNKSSMLQDKLKSRKTEIDTINGAIVSEAVKCNVKTPVNEVLTDLIKLIEKAY